MRVRVMAMAILAAVSTADLERACVLADSILGDALVVKAAPEDARLEEFRTRYTAALEKVLRGQFDRFESEGLRGEIDEIVAWAEKAFGPELAEKLLPEARKHLKSAFRLGQAARVVPDNVKVLWDRPRKEALDWLVEHDRFWIGKVFPEHLSGGFRETIVDGMERGLGRADIARMLQSQVIGTPEAPTGVEHYRRVASTTVNRARNWGGAFSLHTAGFTEYEIRAVMDERTSAVCFPGRSPVTMADGSWQPIESIRPGDAVLTPSGPRKVTAASVRMVEEWVELRLASGPRIESTPEHPFSSRGMWVAAGDLDVNDLVDRLGEESARRVSEGDGEGGRPDDGRSAPCVLNGAGRVAGKRFFRRRSAAYNLEVQGDPRYFVSGVLVHNCRMMNGKVFRVRDAMASVEKALAGPPSAIEAIAPFPRHDAEAEDHYIEAGGSRQYLAGKNPAWLAGHGLSLPPYHCNCRTTYIVTREQVEEHREVVEPASPPFEAAELAPVKMRLDGMHTKQVYEDPDGARWLFKPVHPNEEYRAWGDYAAAELARKLGVPTPEVYVTEVGGKAGSIQRMFDVAGNLRGVSPAALSPDELAAVQREHVFDWLISNHDGHPGNMVRTKDGRLVGIDKGQLFKFFGRDRLAVSYNPNPEPSLYNDVFGAYARGEDVKLVPLAHAQVEGLLKRIDDLPEDEFRRILSPYAKRAAAAGQLAHGTEEAFLEKAVARKRSVRADVEKLYRDLEARREKALGAAVAEAEALTPIDETFVRGVREAGARGRSLLVAGDDFENMNLLAYEVQGKGLFLEGKLRAGSQSKLLARLGLDAGAAAPDPYWDRVLRVAKSYNHHLGPEGDGKVPEGAAKLWRELLGELGKDASGRAKEYRAYLGSLASEKKGEIAWSRAAVGRVVEKHTPSAADLAPLSRFEAKTTEGWDYKKKVEDGRIRAAAGKRTFKGTAYDVDLGDGVRLHYIQHGDGNRFSKFGKVRVEVSGETPEALGRAVGKLRDLGLDSRLASPADMECLYLSKVTYAAGYADQVRIAPEMPAAERVRAYREFWAKKLNARDLTKLPGYSPEPEFARDRGWARWNRFDVDRDEFERRMRGYSLGHSLHGDRAKAIGSILDSQGSLVATEEKLRIGVPVKGMSPQRDQETGGASYVFTRIAPPGKERRFDLVFDKRLLLDPDTVSYESDYFGRVEADFLKKHRKRGIDEWIETSRKSGNETLVRNNVPLVEYLEQVNVRDAAERRKVIDTFKRHGVTTVRGTRVEDVVKVTK